MVAVKATSLLQGHLVEQSVLQLQTVTMQHIKTVTVILQQYYHTSIFVI